MQSLHSNEKSNINTICYKTPAYKTCIRKPSYSSISDEKSNINTVVTEILTYKICIHMNNQTLIIFITDKCE